MVITNLLACSEYNNVLRETIKKGYSETGRCRVLSLSINKVNNIQTCMYIKNKLYYGVKDIYTYTYTCIRY